MGIQGGGGRLRFCEKWLNLATGVSSWGEAFSEYRDRPQIMTGCKFYISVLWIGGRGPFFLGRVKSANLNILCKSDNRPALTLSLSNFSSFLYCLFYCVISVLDKESHDLKVLAS